MISKFDDETGMNKLSNQLESIQDEIKVWERSKSVNVIKIFELFDDYSHPELYLLMEKA